MSKLYNMVSQMATLWEEMGKKKKPSLTKPKRKYIRTLPKRQSNKVYDKSKK